MRSMKINEGWHFELGALDWGQRMQGKYGDRMVNLPHDYMIAGDVYADAPAGGSSGYYNAGWPIT